MIEESVLTIADSIDAEELEVATLDVATMSPQDEVLEYVNERCRGFVKDWLKDGLPDPIVGYGLENGEGILVAEAELAWPTAKVAAMFSDQEGKEEFESAGWKVFEADALAQHRDDLQDRVGEQQ